MNQIEFENARTMIQTRQTDEFLKTVEGLDATHISFDHRNSLLQTACYYGDIQSSKAMLAIGADDMMAFEDAFERGDITAVETLIACGEEWDSAVFRFATRQGHIPLVEHVLSKGFDINHEDSYGLKHSTYHNEQAMSKYLIDNGANAGDQEILINAVAHDDVATVNKCFEHGAITTKPETLVIAAERGHTDWVEKFLNAGADIHHNQDMPFRFAAENGHADTVDLLLKKGSDIHAFNDQALIRAAEHGHSQVLYTLIVKHDFNLSDKTKEHLQEHGQYEPFKIIEKNELRKRLEAKSSNINRPQAKKQSHTMKI